MIISWCHSCLAFPRYNLHINSIFSYPLQSSLGSMFCYVGCSSGSWFSGTQNICPVNRRLAIYEGILKCERSTYDYIFWFPLGTIVSRRYLATNRCGLAWSCFFWSCIWNPSYIRWTQRCFRCLGFFCGMCVWIGSYNHE